MAKPNLEYAICYADGGCRGNQNDSNIGAWAYTIAYQGSTMQNSGTARRCPETSELGINMEFLHTLKEHSVRIITSSDAHCPEDVGYKILELEEHIIRA